MERLEERIMSNPSPLRYPGGKKRLSDFIGLMIEVLVKKSVGNFLNQQQLPITDIFYAVPIAFLSDCAQG